MRKLIYQTNSEGTWQSQVQTEEQAARLKKLKAHYEKKAEKKAKKAEKAQSREDRRKNGEVQSRLFYKTEEWAKVRYEVLRRSSGKCELCGRSAHDGVILNVDHIKPRRRFPHLALDLSNLQVLCGQCNRGKGGTDDTDWRGTE